MLPEVLMAMNRQSMWLKCAECGILKNGVDEMEAHVKTEHLNWLPFKCPQCGCLRALHLQMREHLHSCHRSSQTNFHFEDNSKACSKLRDIMDNTIRDSFISPSKSKTKEEDESKGDVTIPSVGQLELNSRTECGLPPTPIASPTADDELSQTRKRHLTANDCDETSPSSSYSAVVALLNRGSAEDDGLAKKMKTEEPDDEEENNDDNEMPVDPLAAYLSGLGVLFNENEAVEMPKEVKVRKTRSSTMKFCTKCNKGVKSNEKGAHVSFHLSRDYKMNRFVCMIGECDHGSYRKVNLVNHQMKTHGLAAADNSLIHDRQQEMAHAYQTQMVELFGKNDGEDANEAIVNIN